MIDEKILAVFKKSKDEYVSGEDLSSQLGISRAGIWKHIEKLRETGYDIEASPHLGYRLIRVPDKLISEEIRWGLGTKILGKEIISYGKVDSTNEIGYSLAEKGLKEGAVIFAEEQGKGKGRLGRTWASPPKGGIYLSCILRPKMAPSEVSKITLAASVSVAAAVRELSGLQALIRWPNDILVNGKKVCGILTEMKAEQDTVDFLVIGIGVNVNTRETHLPEGASSLKEESGREVSRVELAKGILRNLEYNYVVLSKKGFSSIRKQWKGLTHMLGSRVKISLPNRRFEGQAMDIDPDGALLVRLDTGFVERVSSGDVVIVR
ncbi:biotin--[acetyl-CoA-carboxylase] ligase [Candidatus Omnitrophota bacterium]